VLSGLARAAIRVGVIGFRDWVLQDWTVNDGRPDSQLLLAWFRLAQWGTRRWGRFGRFVVNPCWLISCLVIGVELPVTTVIGPRLRLYHPNGIVLNPHSTLGSDCHLRHGVTIGNRVDRDGTERGVATLGDAVDLGAGCMVIGDIHVGDHARIGALALVLSPVPDWGVVAGNPARLIRVEAPESLPGPGRLEAA
jgi:putative colanic acid biosynthesis acetyltransferase WcaB